MICFNGLEGMPPWFCQSSMELAAQERRQGICYPREQPRNKSLLDISIRYGIFVDTNTMALDSIPAHLCGGCKLRVTTIFAGRTTQKSCPAKLCNLLLAV